MTTTMVKWDMSQFSKAVKRFPGELYESMRPAAETASRDVTKKVKRDRLSGPRGSAIGVRTGMMRRALKQTVFGRNISTLGYTVYFDDDIAPYAKHHEAPPSETVVKAKDKLLAVPLPDAMTRAGVVRTEYDPGKGGTLRDIPGLKLRKYASGALILVKEDGAGNVKHLFVLKEEIRFKRRLGFGEAFEDLHDEGGQATEALWKGFEHAVREWNRGR